MLGRPPNALPNPPNRIREIRLTLRLTQKGLGSYVAVSAETIRKWETGENAVTLPQIERLAAALGLKPQTLMNA